MANGREGKIARLTGREREVATLVCNGLSNKIVAQKLKVSEGTIKIHLHTIFQKLGVRGRSELAVALFGIINVRETTIAIPLLPDACCLLRATPTINPHKNPGDFQAV